MEGILVITALRCKLTRDTEAFGKMDPYCLFQVQDQKAMTKVIIDAGKECEWNETFTFHIKDGDKLKYQVWDEDPGTDDLVGEGFLTIGQYYVEKQSFWLALTYGDKTAGELAIEIQLCALEKDKIEKTKNLQNLIKEKTSQLEQFVKNKQPDVEIINSNNDQDDERKKQILKAIEIDKIKIFELESNLKEAKTKIQNQLDDENYVLAQQKKKIDCLKEENENLSKILDNFSKKKKN